MMAFLLAACGAEAETKEPVKPIELIELIEPTEPTEPIEPIEPVELVEPTEPWTMPEGYISDFGRMVAEEFLVQFESLFILSRFVYDDPYEERMWDNSSIWLDRYGNEVTADEVPFLLEQSGNTFIASSFQLHDLNHDGIPEISMTFMFTTNARGLLFWFIDGEYRLVAMNAGGFWFFYSPEGNLLIIRDAPLEYLLFDGENVHFEYSDWERDDLLPAPRFLELEQEISQSIVARLTYYENPVPEEPLLRFFAVEENVGVTNANVRLFYVKDWWWARQWREEYALFVLDLNDFESYHDFSYTPDTHRSQHIVFTTEQTVYDFEFFWINWDGDIYWPKPGEVRFSVPQLTPKKPIVLNWMGTLHFNSGMSFLDENGVRRFFAINDSLQDVSLFIVDLVTDIGRLLGMHMHIDTDWLFGNLLSSYTEGLYTHLVFDTGVSLLVYHYGGSTSIYMTDDFIVEISVDFAKAERGFWRLGEIGGAHFDDDGLIASITASLIAED